MNCIFINVAYGKALAEGEMDVAYARSCVLGNIWCWKIELQVRSLMKEPWNLHTNSTIIIDTHCLRPIGRE